MNVKHFAFSLFLFFSVPATGQAPPRLELVRCTAGVDAPCFQTVGAQGAPVRIVAVGPAGIVGLGRVGTATWRPPLLAMPVFRGVADSSLLAPALREALIIGNSGGSDRPVIALLLAMLVGFAWVAVQRLGWDKIEMSPKREHGAVTRTTIGGTPDDEAPPRSPDDVTRQTARRTALRR